MPTMVTSMLKLFTLYWSVPRLLLHIKPLKATDVVLMLLTYTIPAVPDMVPLADRIVLKSAVPPDSPLEVGYAVALFDPLVVSMPYQTPVLAGCVGAPVAGLE